MSDRERDREGERIVCELLDCMYSFFHIYTMNGATRASDGIFKTVISNVVLCKRGHRKYYITHLYQMLGKYVDHRWSHARKRSLGVCTHTIRSTSILCTAVRTKSLNKNLTLNLVTGNNKLIPKIDSNLRYIDHSAPNRNTQWCYMYISSMNHCLEKNSKIELHTWALVLFDFDVDVDSIWRCAHDMTLPSKKSVCMSN